MDWFWNEISSFSFRKKICWNLILFAIRQDPTLGEDKGGLLGPKKDKYKICSLLDKTHPKFWIQAAEGANSARLLDIKMEVRA